jgi:hypothetical protein|tara:strand:+ start:461 stop:841 length:381 start_codon:yes stop_codon:yes gene_type:complete
MKVTKEDVSLLKRIADAFSTNLITSKGEEALQRFMDELSPMDYFNIFAARTRKNLPTFRSNKIAAKRELDVCLASYEPLKRTFGENAMVQALPEEAISDRVIDLCDSLKAKLIADLCRKKKDTLSR